MKKECVVSAYPGLPIIFAEGIREPFRERISRHDSIGLALTSVDQKVKTETRVKILPDSEEIRFRVNNQLVYGKRDEGMRRIIELMRSKSGCDIGLNIESFNHEIVTGSSDSGAAALVVALNTVLELDLRVEELLNLGHYGSETVFRSLMGGLSEYRVGNSKKLSAEVIAKPEEFSRHIAIYALPFEGERFSADQLHAVVVEHPNYVEREKTIREKINEFKKHLVGGDYAGVLEAMESDARVFHSMVEDLGFRVIKEDMRSVCKKVEQWRSPAGGGLQVWWNVAGGNQIYVFCLREHAEKVKNKLKKTSLTFSEYKPTGAPEIRF